MLKIFPKEKNWRPIYEVIDNSFFAKIFVFPQEVLDQCKKYPNKPQFLPSEVTVALKIIGYVKRVILTSGDYLTKGFRE